MEILSLYSICCEYIEKPGSIFGGRIADDFRRLAVTISNNRRLCNMPGVNTVSVMIYDSGVIRNNKQISSCVVYTLT